MRQREIQLINGKRPLQNFRNTYMLSFDIFKYIFPKFKEISILLSITVLVNLLYSLRPSGRSTEGPEKFSNLLFPLCREKSF